MCGNVPFADIINKMTTWCETPLAQSDRDIGYRASGERCLPTPADGAADRACRKSRRADSQVVIALRGIDEPRVDRHVAGAAALYWSAYPNKTWREVKAAILGSAKKIPAAAGKLVTEGRLDVNALMHY